MRRRPGEVRDAIAQVLEGRQRGASVQTITEAVIELIGDVPSSSVRSYLRLNTPALFARMERAQDTLQGFERAAAASKQQDSDGSPFCFGRATLHRADCNLWLDRQAPNSIHAVVTDPPYALLEYSDLEQSKLRQGCGGIWRIPPNFDGAKRSPLPRFTVLKPADIDTLEQFFLTCGRSLIRALVPGANVVVASNPLLSYVVSSALSRAGLERRGELIRLTMTMRGAILRRPRMSNSAASA